MKTKLLKKVRKRFEIFYVETPPNVDCLVRDYYNALNCQPFYLLKDNFCPLVTSNVNLSKEEVINTMMNIIRRDYSKGRKRYDIGKRSKVWYNQK